MADLVELERRTQTLWNELQKKPIIAAGLDLMRANMSEEKYPYHNVGHAHDVALESLLLGIYSGFSDRQLELLAIAAVYHDTGYAHSYDGNEPFGAKFARDAMHAHGGYSDEEILRVERPIMGTAVRPHPTGGLVQSVTDGDTLGEHLADGDLGNFGKDTFFEQSDRIFREFVIHGKAPSDTPLARRKSAEFSLIMLRNHRYYTPAARMLREPKKLENIAKLEAMLQNPT